MPGAAAQNLAFGTSLQAVLTSWRWCRARPTSLCLERIRWLPQVSRSPWRCWLTFFALVLHALLNLHPQTRPAQMHSCSMDAETVEEHRHRGEQLIEFGKCMALSTSLDLAAAATTSSDSSCAILAGVRGLSQPPIEGAGRSGHPFNEAVGCAREYFWFAAKQAFSVLSTAS